ncbi:50S ribosomal protein L6 [Paraliomyxa miuraensis]|uniref:50S ribosomal protein L6 n=1 Tax=Paraliomyxa miuraensis TaxID=376150 RepID=UPI00224EECEB|nr:50S ribosomal protein L6 [Paraliomyxa miuraensis]MCX4241291.1 50S ribosomal protein L6 [Paraliomyxa miuraensis]
MSRIGNAPITVPKGVTVTTQGQTISVKGPVGSLSFTVPEGISFTHEGSEIRFNRASDSRTHRAMHGMARARTANLVNGCGSGFKRTLEITGVGYRAAVKGQNVDLTLGFSHPISYPLPAGVTAEVTKEGKLVLTAADRSVLGQAAADIRAFRPPEPYKGKGVKYENERIIRKEGKRGKK